MDLKESKTKLWNELGKLEKRASESARDKTRIHFIIYNPGHTALEILNKILKFPPNKKLKGYKEIDIKAAFDIIESPSFLEQVKAYYIGKGNNPETQLRMLRAQKLIDSSVKIPEELIEKVKAGKSQFIRDLWNELEELGAEVRELEQESDGYIGFKILTPVATYLDIGKRKEIIALVKRDNNRFSDFKEKDIEFINSIIEKIREIDGVKMLSIVINKEGNLENHSIDVDEEGNFGYSRYHLDEFKLDLLTSASNPVSIVIRQFLPVKVEEVRNGKKMWIPRKNLYGFVICQRNILPINSKELRESFIIDHKTGEPIPEEENVIYKDSSVLFSKGV